MYVRKFKKKEKPFETGNLQQGSLLEMVGKCVLAIPK